MIQGPTRQVTLLAKTTVGSEIRYSWQEQIADSVTGEYTDMAGGRRGSTAESYAVELNNADVTLPCNVWLRARGLVENIQVYEFQYEVGGGSISTGYEYGWSSVTSITPNDTWVDVLGSAGGGAPLAIDLPAAGTYILYVGLFGGLFLSSALNTSAYANLAFRVIKDDDTTIYYVGILAALREGQRFADGVHAEPSIRVVVSGPTTIKVQGYRSILGSPTITQAYIGFTLIYDSAGVLEDTTNNSELWYAKIG